MRKKKRNIDKRLQISTMMPPALVRDLEAEAAHQDISRSQLIVVAVRQYLATYPMGTLGELPGLKND